MKNKIYSTIEKIEDINIIEEKKCEEILNSKMKPNKSLGVLENLAIKVAGIQGRDIPELKNGYHFIISSDNGIVEEGISSCPIEYTRIVSEAMLNKIAAIGILCDSLKIPYSLVDIGIKNDIPREYKNLIQKKVAKGTKNFSKEPAMTIDELYRSIQIGIELIEEKKEIDFFSNGEMGIGNTTTSSAILYSLVDEKIDKVVGRGGGLSDQGLEKKKNIIIEAVKRYDLKAKDIFEILRCVGGFDIACMVGMYLGAAKEKKPILIDGFISAVAALAATKIKPEVKNYLIATHISEEPGMQIVIKELGVIPFLDMKMRLGEGTGAVLAYSIVKTAMEIPKRMKTKEEVYKLFE